MRHTRRAIALAALCIALAGCQSSAPPPVTPAGPNGPVPTSPAGPGAAATGRGVIGVSVLTTANPFFKEMGDSMKATGVPLGYDVEVLDGANDPARQKDQINDFIAKKVAAIVLCPCDSRSVGTSIKEANKAGIPVFTADIACLDKEAKVVSHIATDNYSGGKLAAEAMIEALGGKGKVAIIDYPEVESVILRTKGFHEVISRAKGIKVVAQLSGTGERDTSFKTAQDILEQNPQLDGIFAINDPSALGAVAAIEKAGRSGKIKVIGFDGQLEAKQAIKAGKIYADAVQYPQKIGTLTIETIGKYMSGTKPEPEVLIPTGLYRRADAQKDPALR